MSSPQFRPETVAVRAGRTHKPGAPLNSPIVTASNFRMGGDREYTRGDGTETTAALEQAVGELEGGWCLAFPSGMAAIAAVLDQLPNGAAVVAPSDCYQGVAMTLADGERNRGWRIQWLRTGDDEAWLKALETRPDMMWLESPSNPLMAVADVPRLCAAAESVGVAVAVDNTFATPLLQRPLDHGAAYSIHSVTKFIGGHSDLLGGVVVTADPERREGLERRQLLGGGVIGALEAFLALRGLRTLPLRLSRAQASAADLALRLSKHPAVSVVRYPGLATHPGYPTAKRTMAGPGAVMSFDTVGDSETLDRMLSRLQVIAVATSLGGVESTIERRARLLGQESLPPTLLRLSVGCEHVEDLWADLEQLLAGLSG